MKKQLLTLAMICLVVIAFGQDTIIGWSFPVNAGTDSLNANLGLEQNLEFAIHKQDTSGVEGLIYFTNGTLENDFAATAENWEGGSEKKFWLVEFTAPAYRDFKISSKQRAGGNKPGPRDWKVQYKLNGQDEWTDIQGGTITCANDWTTGALQDLQLPADANYPASSVFVRWIMTSNVSINGTEVQSDGISKIDDILINGVSPTGVSETINTAQPIVYPNPSSGVIHLQNTGNADHYTLCSLEGKLLQAGQIGFDGTIQYLTSAPGLYLLSLYDVNGEKVHCCKVFIQ